MRKTLLIIAIVILTPLSIMLTWNKTAYRDVESLKNEAPVFIEHRGFKITSFDGYEGSMVHGGFVWYQVRDSSDYLYVMAIGEWRGELQLYSQKCLNAVSNSN